MSILQNLKRRPAQTSRSVRRTSLVLVGVLALYALLAGVGAVDGAYLGQGAVVLIAAFGAYGLNLITGYAGLASIGNAGFMAIGGIIGWTVLETTGSFELALLLGGVAGLVSGGIVGAIALRWHGFYLVLATLAVQAIVVFVLQEIQLAPGSEYLAGFTFGPMTFLGVELFDDTTWTILLAVLLAVVILLIAGLVDGRFGRAWMAIRENERAADVCGINVVWMKILTFAIGSAIIAFGGVLAAAYAGSMSYESFNLEVSTSFVAMIIVGGLGSMAGPLLGALVVRLIPYVIQANGNTEVGRALNDVNGGTGLPFLQTILYCAIVLAFLVFEPMGLANLGNRVRGLLARRRRPGGEDPGGGPPVPEPPRTDPEPVGAERSRA
jgi:branched-chain amino acid transport system permease protein